jgi:hypothetical protein
MATTKILGKEIYALSSSYAVSASYAPGGGASTPTFPYTGSAIISGSLTVTGSLRVTSGITGSLFGTASYASYALSASYASTSSFASTASIALQVSTSISTQNLQHNVLFVDTSGPGTIQVDGGLRYNPNQDLLTTTSSYATNALTASFATSASFATNTLSASFATSASYATNALSASYAPSTPAFPYTGSAGITGSLTVVGPTTSTQIGAGAAPSGSVPLDVRAQGALSTDTVLRVRNSANNANMLELNGAGGFFIKRSNGTGLISMGDDGKLAIGYNTSITNHQTSDLSIGYGASIGAVYGGNRVAIGNNANTSLFYGTALGYGASVNANGGLAIGAGTSTTGGDITNPQTAIGMGVGTSAPYSMMFGNVYALSATAINHIANSFMLHLGGAGIANYQNFFVNSNTNIVLRSKTQLTASAHYDTSATNTLTIHSGSIPTTTISGSVQLYAATGSLTDNTRPHFRTGNGTIVWLGDESRLFNVTASRTIISSSQNTISGSSLTVYGSGSAQPVFTVQGSQGELFSITDSLSGSLFSVNDISGLPIMEVFSDNTTLMGSYLAPSLNTTAKVVQTNSGSFTMYSLPTASYDTAFFEYSVRSGSNARAGTIMAVQLGSAVNFTETTTTDFGSTSAVSFTVIVTGSNIALTGSSTSGAWTIKTIVRSI